MDAWGYFLNGAVVRPLVLLVFWVPRVATLLWLVLKYAPRQERWLFYKISWRSIALLRHRLKRRGVQVISPSRGRR